MKKFFSIFYKNAKTTRLLMRMESIVSKSFDKNARRINVHPIHITMHFLLLFFFGNFFLYKIFKPCFHLEI